MYTIINNNLLGGVQDTVTNFLRENGLSIESGSETTFENDADYEAERPSGFSMDFWHISKAVLGVILPKLNRVLSNTYGLALQQTEISRKQGFDGWFVVAVLVGA